MIETGRYKRPKLPRNDCPFCPSAVESETHFMLYCNKYTNIRETYIDTHIKSIKIKHPNQNDLTIITNNLLNPDNMSLAKDVSYVLAISIEIRKNNIN